MKIFKRKLITKPRKRRSTEESDLQCAFLQWLQLQYPDVFKVTASFPNEGVRSKATAARMKREGLKAGMPDIGIFYCNEYYAYGMFIEFKSAKGIVRDNQKEMMRLLSDHGYYCVVCRTLDDAISKFQQYIYKGAPISGN